MRLRSRSRMVVGAVSASLVCVGCGSSSSLTAHEPVSVQQVNGNAVTGVFYTISVGADDRLTVQRIARMSRLTPAQTVMTITRSAGSGRLNAAERAQLTVSLRHVNLRQVQTAGVRGACHGFPIGDVGGVLLDVGGVKTDCAPTSAQPLVSWLERVAAAAPEKVTERTVLVTHLRHSSPSSKRSKHPRSS